MGRDYGKLLRASALSRGCACCGPTATLSRRGFLSGAAALVGKRGRWLAWGS